MNSLPRGGGCRYCARHGFDLAAPARVYVVIHEVHQAVKFGVAGLIQLRNDRIVQHRRLGWRLHSEHPVPTGDDALAVEQSILQSLRSQGHRPFLTVKELSNGWIETFNAAIVTAEHLELLITEEVQNTLSAEPLTLLSGRHSDGPRINLRRCLTW